MFKISYFCNFTLQWALFEHATCWPKVEISQLTHNLVFWCSDSIAHSTLSNPRIIEHPENQYVARNEPATLNCKAEGDPSPIISWYRDGQPVVTANENPSSHRMLLPSGQLFFLRIITNKNTKPDLGVYYCNATNPETKFSVISQSATLELAGQSLTQLINQRFKVKSGKKE